MKREPAVDVVADEAAYGTLVAGGEVAVVAGAHRLAHLGCSTPTARSLLRGGLLLARARDLGSRLAGRLGLLARSASGGPSSGAVAASSVPAGRRDVVSVLVRRNKAMLPGWWWIDEGIGRGLPGGQPTVAPSTLTSTHRLTS